MHPPSPADPWHLLRECQTRSAQEQQLFSGRDWLLVSALVEFLTALYPLYLWLANLFLSRRVAAPVIPVPIRDVVCVMFGVGFLFLALAWWAKYAPFRASLVAFLFYVGLQVWLAFSIPNHFMEGIASRILIMLGLVMAVRTGYRRRHHI
ncbi:hypothetical protein OpiT1DRAFT_03747 [Opitutaceae bacterium TAV1]|nr:hypothetical protein OPIT5_07445 [Opitutaceae bacterium TAV5]EIP99235.1 hypothetical protein OpiT1DRAFT_03747 [Opitutaceae bacterium TAV1]